MKEENWMMGVEQTVPFSMVPYGLIEDERCGVYHIALFAALSRFANYKTGECWPSMPTLSRLTGMSERKMRDVATELASYGWMSVIHRKGEDGRKLSNYYRLRNSIGTESQNLRHDVRVPPAQDAGKQEPVEQEPKNNIQGEFDRVWGVYPNKTGKQQAMANYKKLLKHHTAEELFQAVVNYSAETKDREQKYIKTGGNFFSDRQGFYADYLPGVYTEVKTDKREVDKLMRSLGVE